MFYFLMIQCAHEYPMDKDLRNVRRLTTIEPCRDYQGSRQTIPKKMQIGHPSTTKPWLRSLNTAAKKWTGPAAGPSVRGVRTDACSRESCPHTRAAALALTMNDNANQPCADASHKNPRFRIRNIRLSCALAARLQNV